MSATSDHHPSTVHAVAARYQAWGWPVTLRGDQVRLGLGGDILALIIPVPLAAQVIATLSQWRCSPPVLVHPYAPEHHVFLAAERFGMNLPWPASVHQITGTLLLPPTSTPRGPIIWMHPLQPGTLRQCREIDLIAALRAVLHNRPPTTGAAALTRQSQYVISIGGPGGAPPCLELKTSGTNSWRAPRRSLRAMQVRSASLRPSAHRPSAQPWHSTRR